MNSSNNFFLRIALGLAILGAVTGAQAHVFARDDASGLPVKWSSRLVDVTRLHLKLGKSADGRLDYDTAATEAASAWSEQMGSMQFVLKQFSFYPEVAAAGPATDHDFYSELVFERTVFGRPFDPGVLAVTTLWSVGTEIVAGDITFDATQNWNVYDGPWREESPDLRRVALHELGHLLGLGHPDGAGQEVTAVMNHATTELTALTSDDISGVQSLYGPPGRPPNDDFAQATLVQPVSGSTTLKGYNTNATKQLREPNHADVSAGSDWGRSVWWRWTALRDGNVRLDTHGSHHNTTLAVYAGNALDSLTAIAANNDSEPGKVLTSALAFSATAGTTYLLAVDSVDGDSSGITLNLAPAFSDASLGSLPDITHQPVNAIVTTGNNATFTVTANDATGYQWFFSNSPIAGATSPNLSLLQATGANAGSYHVIVSNAAGSVSSNTVTLGVNPPAAPTPAANTAGLGGGGAPSFWFCGTLGLLGAIRFLCRHPRRPA